MKENYRIISFVAENVKRLTAVTINPQGNVVEINGKNGSGKSSVLDAIWWALAGAKSHQSMPIHKDADTALIQLDLGKYLVQRKFRRNRNDTTKITTSIIVESKDGARFTSPQALLNDLLGQMAFDPMAFLNEPPKKQYEILKEFVTEVDIEEIEGIIRGHEARRRDLNRDAKNARAAAKSIKFDAGTPESEIDVKDVATKLSEAVELSGKTTLEKSDLSHRKASLDKRRESLKKFKSNIGSLDEKIEFISEIRRKKIATINAEYEKSVEEARKQHHADKVSAVSKQADIDRVQKTIDDDESKLEDSEVIQKRISDYRQKLSESQKTNENVRLRKRQLKLTLDSEKAETKAAKFTEDIETLRESIKAAVAAADMPVDGLSIKEGQVFFDGIPFEQASTAKKITVSCAIAMRKSKDLRVAIIKNGNDLDDDSFKKVCELADKYECQVWMERIQPGGAYSVLIEDGQFSDYHPDEDQDQAPEPASPQTETLPEKAPQKTVQPKKPAEKKQNEQPMIL